MQAPESMSIHDASLPVTVTVSTSDQPAQVNSVKAEILAMSEDKSFSQPMGQTMNANTMTTVQTIAQSSDLQPFNLNPGESKAIQLSIAINSNPHNPGTLEKVGDAVTTMLNPHKYYYSLHVSADVEGIALDPSASQKLKVAETSGFASSIEL